MAMWIHNFSFLLLALAPCLPAYKILVFAPTASRSMMIANGRIADELALAGHEVLYFEPDFSNFLDMVNVTLKAAKKWPLRGFGNELKEILSSWSDNILDEEGIIDFNMKLYYWNVVADQMCRTLIEDEEVMKRLKMEQFDAIFSDQITFCGHGLGHALGINIKFLISTCPVFETLSYVLGYSTPLSYVPAHGMAVNPLASYWQRAKNLYYATVSNIINFKILEGTTAVFKEKYGSDFPTIEELVANSDAVFVNTDEFLDIPRPIMPNMVNIGGMGAADYDNMELGKEFEEEMSKGEKGVIYFSLGTVVNVTLLPTVFQSVAHLAKAFPQYHFIARAEKEDIYSRNISSNIPNLRIYHWIPQPAVLRHLRLRVFITHGGYNGLMEAARNGVPVIAIPIMLDQPKNAHAVQLNGWGLNIPKASLNNKPQLLIDALGEMLKNQSYKKVAQRISRLIREKPWNATERLVKTTEFIISNGGMPELLMDGRSFSLIHYYNLDILVPFFVLIFVIIYITARILLNLGRSRGNK